MTREELKSLLDHHQEERNLLMATLADLQAAVARIGTDVEALIAANAPVDFQAEVDALNATAATAEAALPAPEPTAEPAAE